MRLDLGLQPPPTVPESHYRAPPPPEPVTPPRSFHLVTVDELRNMPRPKWMIHGVLPESGCGAIYGPSGVGKSFVHLDLVAHLAEIRPWFGHYITPAPYRIVIVVLEGEAGFRMRVEAWEKANERPFPDAVLFVFEPFDLNNVIDVMTLGATIAEAGGADLVVIDTFNRATPGADENSSKDMGLAIEGLKTLQFEVGGFVLVVHHTGKDASKGLRGHSSLFAALDTVIEVSRSDACRQWSVAKSKDGEDGEAHTFSLEVVDLGLDEQDQAMTSCVVRPDAQAIVQHRPRLPKGGNQRIVYDALRPLFKASCAFGKGGAPAIRPCIRLDDAIADTRDKLLVDSDRRTERTRQAITGLIASQILGHNDGWLWLI